MIVEVLTKSLMIAAFVFVMMLAIEYVNMCTRGAAQHAIGGGRWRQYLLASGLGATPGCLGAFASVSLYAHGLLSLGALVGCMIATSGDEAFVLLAMNPRLGLFLMGFLFVVGLGAAWLTDRLWPSSWRQLQCACEELVVHEGAACGPSSWRQIAGYWKQCSAARGVLAIGLLLFIGAIALGEVGPKQWNWIRVTLLAVSLFAIFVVATAPDHFLEEHLWKHVARKHAPRIFGWTFGALLVTHLASSHVGVEQWIQQNPLTLLLVACVLGIIPESGPHLLFVTLFAEGKIPFSVLLASSIVQDGHGMLPLLGDSLTAFAVIKAIDLTIGLLLGLAVFACAW
jgi:hypothetical protein